MDSFWNGVFAPINKHRDYKHPGDPVGHLADQQAGGTLADKYSPHPVKLTVDPVTGDDLASPKPYYLLNLVIDGKPYKYFIPAMPGGLKPTETQTRKQLNRYIKNKDDDLSQLRQDMVDEFGDLAEEDIDD